MPIEIESPEELGYDAIANNLSESSFSDMRCATTGSTPTSPDLLLQYGDHRGLPRLRELIAADGPPCSADDVIVTAGAAAALFIVATALLGAGDHALISSPNYATNLETPRRSRPTSSPSTCASRTAGSSTPSGSPRRCGPRRGSSASPTPTTRPER